MSADIKEWKDGTSIASSDANECNHCCSQTRSLAAGRRPRRLSNVSDTTIYSFLLSGNSGTVMITLSVQNTYNTILKFCIRQREF